MKGEDRVHVLAPFSCLIPKLLTQKSSKSPVRSRRDRGAMLARRVRAGWLLTGFRQLLRSSAARPQAQLRAQAQLFPLLFLTVTVNVGTCLCQLQTQMCQLHRPLLGRVLWLLRTFCRINIWAALISKRRPPPLRRTLDRRPAAPPV